MARSEKNVYGIFISRCKQEYERIAKEETKKNPPLITKNGYEYVPTSANPYWTRLRALRVFYKKYAPLCAWLKYPQVSQVNGETVINHRTYITDFSFISDILADLYSSDSSPDQVNNDVMNLLFCIMLPCPFFRACRSIPCSLNSSVTVFFFSSLFQLLIKCSKSAYSPRIFVFV